MIIDIVLGKAEGRGGLEYVLTLVSQELAQKGHRVRVFQSAPPQYAEWANTLPEIYYYDSVAFGNSPYYDGEIDFFRYILEYRSLIDKMGAPDVILATHVPLFCLVARMATSHLKKSPVILSWMHASFPQFNGTGVLLQYCDRHLAISRGLEQSIKEKVHPESIVYYVGNPVDIKNTKLLPRIHNRLELLYIGRISNREKRIDVLLQALSQVTKTWYLTIIGDGPDLIALKQLATSLGIEKNIEWKGWQEDPWKHVKSASALVLTSQFEPFGIILVEALARGIPVIASRCDGPEDIVQDGENGWLFDVGNVEQLRSIIQGIINGTIMLPTQEYCQGTVERFQLENVINFFEVKLLNSLSHL
jgi:UDP-D-galactose:(glucosyl)LPS alpha-1,6-D-galactosyltransferase